MQLVIDELTVEISKKKINSNIAFPEPQPYICLTPKAPDQPKPSIYVKEELVQLLRQRIYMRKDTGEVIGTTKEIGYRQPWVDPRDGKEVPVEQILWLILNSDGTLKRSKRYEASKLMKGIFPISRRVVENWIPKSVYEIYVNQSKKYYNEAERRKMEALLFKKAEEWYANDKAVLGQYVFKEGAEPYAMLLFPYIKKEDSTCKFCFVAAFSRTKNENAYEHLMEVSTALTPATVEIDEISEPDITTILQTIAT
jgi:hypothetical protein